MLGVISFDVLLRDEDADAVVESCGILGTSFEGGLVRRAALFASNVLQSKSVLGRRGESPAGVKGDGETGLEVVTDGGFDPLTLLAAENSTLILGDRDGGESLATEPSRDTGREFGRESE